MSVGDGALLGDVLWFLVIFGWIIVLLLGLEADKPLSGDLPGHMTGHATHLHDTWDAGDRIGEMAAWVLFGAVGLLLPFLLYWVFTTQGFAL